MSWWVYMVRCADGSLYTGVTTEVERRFQEHAGAGTKAAKYLRGRGPIVLVYSREVGARSEAMAEERRIKRLKKSDKEALLKTDNGD